MLHSVRSLNSSDYSTVGRYCNFYSAEEKIGLETQSLFAQGHTVSENQNQDLIFSLSDPKAHLCSESLRDSRPLIVRYLEYSPYTVHASIFANT